MTQVSLFEGLRENICNGLQHQRRGMTSLTLEKQGFFYKQETFCSLITSDSLLTYRYI